MSYRKARPREVVAEDEVGVGRLAVHVEFDEGGLLVEAPEEELSSHYAAGRLHRAVRLPNGGRAVAGDTTVQRRRELSCQSAAQEAVRHAGIEEALDQPAARRHDQPAVLVDQRQGLARDGSSGLAARASEAGSKGQQLQLQGPPRTPVEWAREL